MRHRERELSLRLAARRRRRSSWTRAPGGWRISAAGCRPTAPDKPFDCDAGELTMRVMFVLYLAVIAAGLAFYSVIGLLHL